MLRGACERSGLNPADPISTPQEVNAMSMIRCLLALTLVGMVAACASPTAPTPRDDKTPKDPDDRGGTSFVAPTQSQPLLAWVN